MSIEYQYPLDQAPDTAAKNAGGLPFKQIERRANALVVPFQRGTKRGKVWPSGVFDADGTPSPHAEMRILTRWAEATPDVYETWSSATRSLSGQWLFCGLGSAQFGHIISRGMGRLWALGMLPSDTRLLFSSIFMTDKKHGFLTKMLASMNLPHEHFILRRPARVEQLYLAPDLYGEQLQGRAAPECAAWLRSRLPDYTSTGRKVYVTRARLDPKLGRLLCEDVLEANLAAAGFEIAAPETMSLDDQLAMYGQSDVVIAAEGSALHVAPFALRDDARLIIVKRRPEVPVLIANQIASFCKAECAYVHAIVRTHWPAERADNLSLAELDFDVMRDDLIALGVLKPDDPWTSPGADDVLASRAQGRPPGTPFLSDEERVTFLQQLRQERRRKNK